MTPQELFDKLVEHKQLTVPYTGKFAESLRVQFVKKFSQYKRYMDNIGYLDDITARQSVSMVEAEESTTFYLRKKKQGFNYTFLEEDGNATEV